MDFTANGQTYRTTQWKNKRVYIKTLSGKDCLYYDIEKKTFKNLRTWGKIGQRERVEAAFLAAYTETTEAQATIPNEPKPRVVATEESFRHQTIADAILEESNFDEF